MILADCLSIEDISDYNKYNGANNYIDPLTQVLCVRFNNAPLMGDYWVEKKERESSDLENFELSPFRAAIEGLREVSDPADVFYQMGDSMKADL